MNATPETQAAQTPKLPPARAALPATPPHSSLTSAEPGLAMELIELELALDGALSKPDDFGRHVREAVNAIDGDYLFDLPASGLVDHCRTIAAVRIPSDKTFQTVFVCLADDGTTLQITPPTEATEGLARFAEAFVGVMGRLPGAVAG